MSFLSTHFDFDVNQCSPVQDDFDMKINYDEDGNEYAVFEKVDYPKIQASHGLVRDWSLNALLKAGINPNFPIHTGNVTRLEGIDTVTSFEDLADDILAQMNAPANEE